MANIVKVDDIFTEIDRSLEQHDLEKLRECLVDLAISKEMIESRKKNYYPDRVLEFLLTKLLTFRDSTNEGGWDIFKTLLSGLENFSEKQFELFLTHIEENYGYYIEPKLSYLMAEWFGGCRDEWAINTIEKWLNKNINKVPYDNLKSALYEFADSPLPYEAEPELVEKARQLRKLLTEGS